MEFGPGYQGGLCFEGSPLLSGINTSLLKSDESIPMILANCTLNTVPGFSKDNKIDKIFVF